MNETDHVFEPGRNCSTPERHPDPVVKVRDIAYLEFNRTDLAGAAAFFHDFGLRIVEQQADRIYLRAAGPDHHCVVLRRARRNAHTAVGFYVDDASDLSRLAALPEATPVQDVEEPGGGRRVSLPGPDGIRVDAVYGRSVLPETGPGRLFESNTVRSSRRVPRINEAVRIAQGPARPYRLGHTVQGARDVDRTIRWYQEHLGLIVSDFQFAAGVSEVMTAFLRCDRGATPTDHHTVAIAFAPIIGHVHSAFECHDLDDLMAGHVHLRDRRRRHSWGIGRHVLGSQIFDYWRDPAGDMFEHYADGDRFDAAKTAGYFEVRPRNSHHQWGPPMTRDFLGLTPDLILRDLPGLVRRFLDRRDPLTPGKLQRMARDMETSRNFYKQGRV